MWDEKGRTPDLLWTGTAYREYELWRERYTGALTAFEREFARAMTEKARRRRRLWTGAVATAILASAGIAVAIGISRQQATKARDQAQAEALRAEAGKLLALGRGEIDRYPAVALAYARRSLELADTSEGRRLAVEILWRGPLPRVLPLERVASDLGVPPKTFFGQVAVSPDGRWLATRSQGGHVLLFPANGGAPRSRPGSPGASPAILAFGPASDRLATGGPAESLSLLSLPDLREIRRLDLGDARPWGTSRTAGW